jgi:hypothetical protein
MAIPSPTCQRQDGAGGSGSGAGPDRDEDVLAAHAFRLTREGGELDSPVCDEQESEGA